MGWRNQDLKARRSMKPFRFDDATHLYRRRRTETYIHVGMYGAASASLRGYLPVSKTASIIAHPVSRPEAVCHPHWPTTNALWRDSCIQTPPTPSAARIVSAQSRVGASGLQRLFYSLCARGWSSTRNSGRTRGRRHHVTAQTLLEVTTRVPSSRRYVGRYLDPSRPCTRVGRIPLRP